MTRYTLAYSAFVLRMKEIETLQKMALLANVHRSWEQMNALVRSGVVLLSSHIEGYVEELGEIAIDSISARGPAKTSLGSGFRYYLSQDILREIKNANDPKVLSTKLEQFIKRDGHIWDSSANLSAPLNAKAFIGDFSNPTYRRIVKFIRRFGYDQYERDICARLGPSAAACINAIDQIVDQRNRVAHGDTVVTGTPSDLGDLAQLTRLFVRSTDCAVADWFRSQSCPIR